MTTALPKSNPDQPIEPEFETETMKIATYETATETISAYLGYLNTQIFYEEKQPHPNQLKIRALEEQIKAVAKERKAILPDDEMLIAKSLYIYAPIMKALHANGQQIQA
jgi:hypothetical protein